MRGLGCGEQCLRKKFARMGTANINEQLRNTSHGTEAHNMVQVTFILLYMDPRDDDTTTQVLT